MGVFSELEPGVKYIMEAGIKAKCDVQVIIRALVIHHHFMRCIDDVKYDPAMVAAAALHLSSKIGEKEIKVGGLVYLFYHMVNGSIPPNMFPCTQKYSVLEKSISTVENIMLRMLEYTLKYDIAHQYFVPFMNVLLHRARHIDGFQEVMSESCMKYMFDFYTHRMCLNYKPEDIAIACIDAALHFHGFVQHLEMFHPWHEGFSVDLTEEKVKEMTKNLFKLYKKKDKVRPSADLEEIVSSPENGSPVKISQGA